MNSSNELSFYFCIPIPFRNESVCFLHVNHIEIDKAHQINATNWNILFLTPFSCYSLIIQSITLTEKSELDYEHKVGLSLKTKEAIVGTFDHLSLEHCASRCNSDPNCFTLEFCQSIDYDRVSDSSVPLTSCSLTNLKPSNANQTGLFEETKSTKKICSIYINHNKIRGKSKTDPQPSTLIKPPESPTKSNNLKIAFGLGTIVCLMAFAGLFWFLLISTIITIATQMNYLNKSLDIFDATIVTPVYYVFFTTCVLIASSILFSECSNMKVEDIIGVFVINIFKDTNLGSFHVYEPGGNLKFKFFSTWVFWDNSAKVIATQLQSFTSNKHSMSKKYYCSTSGTIDHD
uniref:Uncharacterized protein n=1 Tax=Tetranychus urticae TaxID=32264 RepID=T1KG97_TETUR